VPNGKVRFARLPLAGRFEWAAWKLFSAALIRCSALRVPDACNVSKATLPMAAGKAAGSLPCRLTPGMPS